MIRPARRSSVLLLVALAGCRQAAGLDDFQFPSCVPGEPGCPLLPEDCVAGLDTNGDAVTPPSCTGEVVWARSTEPDGPRSCPSTSVVPDQTTIDPSRHLTALRSFGAWAGAIGTVRGSLGTCDEMLCTLESFAQDTRGEGISFAPRVPCEDTALFGALARGEDRAYAASALDRDVAVSSHRITDGSFAARWSFQAPEKVTSLALTAGAAAVLALGQDDHTLLVQPDPALPTATFHTLQGADLSAIALSGTTLLLAGVGSGKATDTCAAAKATAFIARAELADGSGNAASPSKLTCNGFPLKVGVGADTNAPVMRLSTSGSRACWAYGGTNGSKVRTVRVGCFDLKDASFGWKQEHAVGSPDTGEVDIAMDGFGNVLLAAMIDPSKPLSWGTRSIKPIASGTPNIVLLKLAGATGDVVWARVFASPGGKAREPHVSADDDGLVRLGVVTDGAALIGDRLAAIDSASGPRVHFVGIEP